MVYEDVKKLIDDMGKVDFNELNLEFPDGVKISMKKHISSLSTSELITSPEVVTLSNIKAENSELVLNEIKSPMVGTFYSSSAPGKAPFVKLGDKVKKGQVLCIIEAMKLMNEIESEFDGEIVEICVPNEGVVEYGMPLFKIK